MHEINAFGTIVLIVGAAFVLAVLASKLTSYLPVPGAGALPARRRGRVGHVPVARATQLSIKDGRADRRRRADPDPLRRRHARRLAALPRLGRSRSACSASSARSRPRLIIAVAAHALFDFSWTTAGIVGAALAPTDPAVDVLGARPPRDPRAQRDDPRGRVRRERPGRDRADDRDDRASHAHGGDVTFWTVVGEFALEMAVGLRSGYRRRACCSLPFMRRSLPERGAVPAAHARRRPASSTASATVAHGSGFLAVFVAGILIGDARAPYKAEIEGFHRALASLAEITVFVALGLTIDLTDVFSGRDWLEGARARRRARADRAAARRRPAAPPRRACAGASGSSSCGAGSRERCRSCSRRSRCSQGVDHAQQIYEIVFVVVAFSVIVQGSLVPSMARLAARADADVRPRAVAHLHAAAQGAVRRAPLHRRAGVAGGRRADRGPAALRARVDRDARARRRAGARRRLDRARARRRGARHHRRARRRRAPPAVRASARRSGRSRGRSCGRAGPPAACATSRAGGAMRGSRSAS